MNIIKRRLTAVILILLASSLAANVFMIISLYGTKQFEEKYKYIDPILSGPQDSNDLNAVLYYGKLREKILSDIQNVTSLDNVGVYIQNIKTGSWVGINEREGFLPASLLKIPIMMVILKKIDREEMRLDDIITLTEKDIEAGSGDLYKTGAGKNFTVWELLKKMILSSDNTAKNALKRYISQEEMNSIFEHVGITNPYINADSSVTPRGFIRFFKSIYYSTFLSPKMSAKAIDITIDTSREDLLKSGIPREVILAHKYGQLPYELHDCGIVYYPKNPYFICVMTKGLDNADEKMLIAKISKDVFDFVEKS